MSFGEISASKTQFSFTRICGYASQAFSARNTSSTLPPVIAWYRSAKGVSMLIFTASRPASASAARCAVSRVPFVVSETVSSPESCFRRRTSTLTSRRTSGSPPVILTCLIPFAQKIFTSRSISSKRRISSWLTSGTPSGGMQYRQRRLHRSVTDILI